MCHAVASLILPPKTLREEGAVMAAQYTVDGEAFFDTRVRLKASLLEDKSSDASEEEVCLCSREGIGKDPFLKVSPCTVFPRFVWIASFILQSTKR